MRSACRRPRFLNPILIVLGVLGAADASAATITVTGTGDAIAVDGVVTLREAITSVNNGANVNADVIAAGVYGTNDQIVFNIPGTGVQTIAPPSNLPIITKPVVIDGYTQPGSSPNTLAVGDNAVITIDLSGANFSNSCNALQVQANNTTIRGLAIHACGAPLDIRGSTGSKVLGNFLGIDPTGTTVDWPSITYVLTLQDVSNSTIGGTAPADRNIISGGEGGGGIFIHTISAASTGNVIQGNYIGTNAAGTAALRNSDGVLQLIGISLGNSTNTLIGGTAAGAGNLISGHLLYGVYLGSFSDVSNIIQGNLIGTDATGSAPIPNGSFTGSAGIVLVGNNNMIGGTAPGAGNVIAFSAASSPPVNGHGQGVIVISGAIGNTIRGNSIFSNAGLGIDLNDDGVTLNHPCETGIGPAPPNKYQNFPVRTSAVILGSSTRVTGTLNSKPSTTYTLDFYSNAACDPTGYGEGQTYLGSATVSTDASCNGSFDVTLPIAPSPQSSLTATATDPGGNTSEFSACISFAAQYYTVTPCRVADTRNPVGPYGGPALNANADRSFIIAGQCGIPATAKAVAYNFTVTQPTALGDVRTIPGGIPLPVVSTMNWRPGQTRANNAILPLPPSGDIVAHVDQVSGTVHFIIDVTGYFQ